MHSYGRARRRTFFLAALLCIQIPASFAQAPTATPPPSSSETPETLAFKAAARAFTDGIFNRAEDDFAEFAAKYPASPQVPEAVLLQARSALKQDKPQVAIELLQANLGRAGALADEYRFWLAEARLRGGDYPAAADAFAAFIRQYTNSVRQLEAAVGEARARFKLRQFAQVVEGLRRPEGAFQRALQVRANDPFAVRGQLLLAEALIEEQQSGPARQALQRLAAQQLVPEDRWQAQYLESRIEVAEQHWPDALALTTNLVASATAAGRPGLVAQSWAQQGDLLARLGRFDDAEKAFAQNLGDVVPPEHRRMALLRIIDLELARGETAAASRMLDEFLAKYPADRATDVALLTQGEVFLKQHLSGIPAAITNAATGTVSTNLLAEAQARFDKVIASHPDSPIVGKAWLDRGWSLWAAGQTAESVVAFSNAADRLPPSADLAVADFKLGDVSFQLGDLTNAIRFYERVAVQFATWPEVRTNLIEQALYQRLRAHLALRDLDGAGAVARQLDRDYPRGALTARAVLLLAEGYEEAGQAERARTLLADFAKRFPGSPLAAEAGLAVARSYSRECRWEPAVKSYERWLAEHPTGELRPEAEFQRAWALWQAGGESNSFVLFTNLLATFPTNPMAARAQFWLGDYYFRQGDYPKAEQSYQLLAESTNWPVSRLTYQARMMAGRAAFARQSWKDAGGTNPPGHFILLVNDTNCPPDIAAEAFFALGDTMLRKEADPARPLAKFNEAREAYSKIPQLYPTNRLVNEAWGMIGNCYLQMAAADPKFYDNAIEAYQRVVTNATASVAVRSQAEIGIAQTVEKLAQTRPVSESTNLVERAFNHYYNIVSEKNLKPGERPDAFWFKEAGLAAAGLAERRGQWEIAAGIYERLLRELPPLREMLQSRLEKAQEQLRLKKT